MALWRCCLNKLCATEIKRNFHHSGQCFGLYHCCYILDTAVENVSEQDFFIWTTLPLSGFSKQSVGNLIFSFHFDIFVCFILSKTGLDSSDGNLAIILYMDIPHLRQQGPLWEPERSKKKTKQSAIINDRYHQLTANVWNALCNYQRKHFTSAQNCPGVPWCKVHYTTQI